MVVSTPNGRARWLVLLLPLLRGLLLRGLVFRRSGRFGLPRRRAVVEEFAGQLRPGCLACPGRSDIRFETKTRSELTGAIATPPEQHEDEDSQLLGLNPYVRVIRCSDDEIVVRHGTRSQYSEVISDSARNHLLGRLLTRLREPASLADLTAESFVAEEDAETLVDAVAYLRERRVLVPAAQDWRQSYFDTFFGDAGGLSSRTIGVIGGGAVARRVCASLAPLGAEAIIALDDDSAGYPETVELQGDPWTDQATLLRLFSDCDLVIVSLDGYSPRLLHLSNEAALTSVTPWVCAFFDGHEAVIGPTFVPGQTGCYAEFDIQAEASLTQINEGLLIKESLSVERPSPGTLLPPYVDIASGFVVDAAIRFLLAGSSYTVGRAMRIDFERAAIDYQDVLTMPRCPACQATRGAYRHVFL